MVGREGRSGEGGSGEEGRRGWEGGEWWEVREWGGGREGWESNQVQTLSYGLAAVVERLVMGQ